MELKGIIKKGEPKSVTCCQSVNDILIGELSLYEKLEKLFAQDAGDYWDDYEKKSPIYGVKYVILDMEPETDTSFNNLSAEVQQNMMYAEHYSGCYSEYTCGYGGFDYVVGTEGTGHSVFEELLTYEGKYVHFII